MINRLIELSLRNCGQTSHDGRHDKLMAEQGRLKKRRQKVCDAPAVAAIAVPPIFPYALGPISQSGGRT